MTLGGHFKSRSLVACVLLSGCGQSAGPNDSRPADLPGTLQTALALAFGADAQLQRANADINREDATFVELCLTPDGACVPADFRVDECYRYDDIQAFVDGVEIPLVWPGGWTDTKVFEPLPSGGNGYGCSYPLFDTNPSLDLGLGINARSSSQEITIRVGDEEVTFTLADWLVDLTVSVPDTLVKGADVFVGIEPSLDRAKHGRTGAAFIYDNLEVDDPNKRFNFIDAEPEAWSQGGFVLSIPPNMPTGAGAFWFVESFVPVEVTSCPFTACEVTVVKREALVEGITVVEP